VPTFYEYNINTKEYTTKDKRDTLFMFRDKSDSQAEFMKAYEKSSQLNKGKFLHAYLDIVGDTQREAAETMKLELGTKKLLRALYRGHVYICETPQEELDF
jgi:hypothetical protein